MNDTNNIIYTHQPFLFKKADKIKLLHCQSKQEDKIIYSRPWKIFIKDLDSGGISKINTPFNKISSKNRSEAIIECNPSLYELDGKFFLTYIKGVFEAGLKYDLVQYEVPDLDFDKIKDFTILKSNIFSGCVVDNKIYSLAHQIGKIILIEDFSNKDLLDSISSDLFNFESITRVNSIFKQNKLIVTGLDKKPKSRTNKLSVYKSYIYDIDKKCIERELLNKNGESLYKSSIIDNKLAYALKLKGFEDRRIEIEDYN